MASSRQIDRAIKRLGAARVTAFLRAALEDHPCMAVKLINEDLDEGKDVTAIFLDEHSGFSLDVRRLDANHFRISFGCVPGPMVGDGGEWDVVFDDLDQVVTCIPLLEWMS